MWLWLQLIGCGVYCGNAERCATTDPKSPVDCESIAMADGAGLPDPCDVAACDAAVQACGDGGLVVEESFPVRYACASGGAGAWDVYAMCPDWQPPGDVYAAEVEDLGCDQDATEVLTATSTTPGRIDVVHEAYSGSCCPQSFAVHVLAGDQSLDVQYSVLGDQCECTCARDISYALIGVAAGDWTLDAGRGGATAAVTVP